MGKSFSKYHGVSMIASTHDLKNTVLKNLSSQNGSNVINMVLKNLSSQNGSNKL